jgi:type II secretory pathway predicted ATPase ExeA
MLVKKVVSGLAPNVHAACVDDPRLSFNELIGCAAEQFGLSELSGKRLAMMGRISDYLVRQFERGHIACLLVDEAQNLSDEILEELRLLSNLETNTDKLLQIVLLGRPEFEKKLDRPELFHLKQRVVLRCRLRPLEEHEVGSYIELRLKTVKSVRLDLFDPESIARIAFHSRGVPRLINTICDHALTAACESGASRVAAALVEQVACDVTRAEGAENLTEAASVSKCRRAPDPTVVG